MDSCCRQHLALVRSWADIWIFGIYGDKACLVCALIWNNGPHAPIRKKTRTAPSRGDVLFLFPLRRTLFIGVIAPISCSFNSRLLGLGQMCRKSRIFTFTMQSIDNFIRRYDVRLMYSTHGAVIFNASLRSASWLISFFSVDLLDAVRARYVMWL